MKEIIVKETLGKKIFVIIGCFLFAIIGLFMIALGEISTKLMGFIAVLFFGGGGALYLFRILQTGGLSLKITDRGITINKENFIPWSNVKRVGIVNMFNNKMLGILLKNPSKNIKKVKLDSASKALMGIMTVSSFGLKTFPHKHSHRVSTKNLPNVEDTTSVEGMVRYNLKTTGYHLTYPGGFDRPLEEIVSIMRKHIKS